MAAGLSMFSLSYSTHTVVLSVLPTPIQKVDQYSSYDRAVLDSVETHLIRRVKEAFLKEMTSKLRNAEWEWVHGKKLSSSGVNKAR